METSKSPLPKKSDKELNFSEVIKEFIEGKKIHKLEWIDKDYYGVLSEGILKLHKPDGKLYVWSISDGDLMGDDYIIL